MIVPRLFLLEASGVTLYLQKGNAMKNEELVARIRNRIDAAECMAQLWAAEQGICGQDC